MNGARRGRPAAVEFPTPTFRFRVWPCEFCGACHCPCIRGDIPVRRAAAAVTKRHRESVKLARLTARRAA